MATVTTTPAMRSRPDRFLIAILVGLAVLLVAGGLALVLARQPAPTLPADTPGGTVQRFYLALAQQDYDQAYSFLSSAAQAGTTRDEFIQYNLGRFNTQNADQSDSLRIASAQIHGDEAVVSVAITHYYSNPAPFGGASQWSENEAFMLRRDAGAWRITTLPPGYLPDKQP